MKALNQLTRDAVQLLGKLISIPSLSREENKTADLLEEFLKNHSKNVNRRSNNVWCVSDNCDSDAPVILLNSHHDTVKPTEGWTYDPYQPVTLEDQLFGLGSNDAGASVVSLLVTFLFLSDLPNLPYRMILALTGEEEISGPNGVSSILEELGPIELAIVGEPTEMQMAIAEKGLVVLDCVSEGKAGHAARNEGENAIYLAMNDIRVLSTQKFPLVSKLLGPVKLTVTQIKAGHQHNVVPARCDFVVDVRTNEHYSNKQVVNLVKQNVQAAVVPRSLRLNSSSIPLDHPVVKKGLDLGLSCYGSPTLSDQAIMQFPSLKIGPGKSSRSHTPDEFILLSEIKHGITTYVKLLTDLNLRP